MAAEASNENQGEHDVLRVLLSPDEVPGARDLTLGALLEAEHVGSQAWPHVGAGPSTRVGDLDADHRYWIADLVNFWRTVPRDVAKVVSPADGMYAKTPDSYFGVGARALRWVRLALLEVRKEKCENLLDFACGFGRALRYFRVAFPDARIVACDISREAVDFCAQEFGAVPVYSREDPTEVELPGPFDVIWVGSLFTHVPEERWIGLLDLLASTLSSDGLLLFTVQGRTVREQLRAGELEWNLADAAIEEILRGYDERGFGYADWSDVRGYGSSLSRPSWVAGQIESRPGLRLMGYRETGWGRQDVVTCQAIG